MSSYSLDDLRESMVKILNPDNNNVVGSGFIVREDGYLITCHHVIYLLSSLKVEYRGKVYEADWCAEFSNPDKDIAVLKINVENAKAVPIINPSELSTSVKVYGFPQEDSELRKKFTQGFDFFAENIRESVPINPSLILFDEKTKHQLEGMQDRRQWNRMSKSASCLAYRIDTKVYGGTSGGAVFSEELGGVVGVIQSTKKSDNQSYVIRWDNIRDELEKLNLEPQKNAVCEFLEDIENNFKYIQLFHSKQQIVLKEQYIPIQVSLEAKRKDVEDFFIRDVESGNTENELKRVYAIKGMGEETQPTKVDWKEAKQEHEKIMVLADPGMGKSTLLRMEAGLKAVEERLNLASNSSSQLTARIENLTFPLFLRLSDLDEQSGEVIDIIPEIIQRNYPKTAPGILHLLKQKLQQGKYWLFLDALDEVPKENRNDLKDKINRFTNNYPCKIICTSRIVGYGGAFVDGAKEVEIVPFTPKQTEEYIQTWFTNAADYIEDDSVSAEKLITELQEKTQISGLTQNPLLLSLVCSLYQTKGLELPARKAQVYQKAVDYMLREWRNDNNRLASEDGWVIAKIELLESLAYQFSCEGKEVFTLREIRDDINKFLETGKGNDFKNITTTELITELCEEDGIIQKLTREGEQYLFLHRTFQEYFTAAYLNRAIEKNQRDGIALARKLFWEYDFHETLILLVGLMKNPFSLIKAITNEKDDIFKTQLLLAGKCLAECESYGEENQKFIEEIVDRVYEFWLVYPNASFIESVVLTLGKSNLVMVEKLILSLNDWYSDLGSNAVKALAKIGNPIAVESLINALNHSNSDVRRNAAQALGEIGNSIAVEPLISALNDSDSDVRRNAAQALGEIGNSSAVEPLIAALNDSDYDMRNNAAKALGEIGNPIAIEGLISALNDSDSDVRSSAAFGLKYVENPIVIEELISALNDSSSWVRIFAADALGCIGNPIAVEGLISALNDSDTDIKSSAAVGLGRIANPIATEVLITALNNSDAFVRLNAAVGLGFIGNSIAIEGLITALNDDYYLMRKTAVQALGCIGNPQLVTPLISSLRDNHKDVRSSAADALGNFANLQVVEVLITVFNNSDTSVRISAAKALANIGNAESIPAFITALNDSNSDVRECSASALSKTSKSKTLAKIIQSTEIDIYDKHIFALART